MPTHTTDVTGIANDLIETCKDGEKGFREAADALQDQNVKSLFRELSQQRAQYAQELQSHVSKLGEQPETTGSTAAALHRGWMNLRSAITGKSDQAIIDEAERGEDVAVEAYQKALRNDLPNQLKSVIETQYQGVQAGHNKVRDLKHNYGKRSV